MTAEHVHRWTVATVPVAGQLPASCACGAARTFPAAPVDYARPTRDDVSRLVRLHAVFDTRRHLADEPPDRL